MASQSSGNDSFLAKFRNEHCNCSQHVGEFTMSSSVSVMTTIRIDGTTAGQLGQEDLPNHASQDAVTNSYSRDMLLADNGNHVHDRNETSSSAAVNSKGFTKENRTSARTFTEKHSSSPRGSQNLAVNVFSKDN